MESLDKKVAASEARWEKRQETDCGISLDDFKAFMPDHRYIFIPTRDTWPASSVNAKVMRPDKETTASQWLDANASVEQMTWYPGYPMLIKDKLIDTGGWIDQPDCTCFNLYRPPSIKPGDSEKAQMWIDHVKAVYPDDAVHIIQWLAHRVQKPQEKINHALVLGGKPGIGKDTLIEPVTQAVGPWNCEEITPTAMMGRFNGFVKSVILRISEARDLGDVDRFSFYDHSKVLIASPPEVIRVDEKHRREYPVPNVCGVLITTNYKTNGLYLPEDDRRHYVAWSELPENPFSTDYWDGLWKWYYEDGFEHVTAHLAQLDLSNFNPKAPPRKTDAFWQMVNASRAPEDAELADVIDNLGNPKALTIDDITGASWDMGYQDFSVWITDRKNRRKIPHRLEAVGYVPVRNNDAKDGLWKINNKRRAVYGLAELCLRDQIKAVYSII